MNPMKNSGRFTDERADQIIRGWICAHGTTRILQEVQDFTCSWLSRQTASIYEGCRSVEAQGKHPDIINITGALTEAGMLEKAGGTAAIIPGQDIWEVVKSSIDSLRACCQRKEAARIGEELANGILPIGEAILGLQHVQKAGETTTAVRDPRIRFFKPSEIVNYTPERDIQLVGKNAILRGEVFVIGGEPGVGKSTAATELAICGALGRDWLGLSTHGKFKTLIIQNENGRYRLQQEYSARGLGAQIEDYILISEPPPYGMTLNHPEFLEDVKQAVDAFMPDLVVFDPWNAAAKDDKAKDYSEAFDALRGLLPKGANKPALGIVAHTRKPQPNEKRTGGTALLHLLSGSYVLTSVPRSVFIMLRGSTDETDASVVWCNPKNNNGPLAPRTAWERKPSGFTSIEDFDWNAFEGGDGGRRVITLEHIQDALGDGKWDRARAVELLEKESGLGKRACQKALSEKSPWASHLTFEGKWVGLKAGEEDES
jgi:hypothetical protein